MKLRRLMQNCPLRTKPTKGQRCASQQIWLPMSQMGHKQTSRCPWATSALPPKADMGKLTFAADFLIRSPRQPAAHCRAKSGGKQT
jgi:hypothetical protein